MEDITADHSSEKKKRKRTKKLCNEIKQQMEFYFSDANLTKDRFLRKEIDKTTDGFVDLDIFAKFNKLRKLTTEMSLVAKALSKSELLQVSGDGKKVKRTTELVELEDVDERTVYVENLPPTANHEWVKEVFGQCGKVVYVSIPKYRTTGDFKGFAFVEFETSKESRKACQLLDNPPSSAREKAGKFPKSRKQLRQLQKQLAVHKPESVVSAEADGKLAKKRKRSFGEISFEEKKNEGKSKKQRKRKRTISEESETTETQSTKRRYTDTSESERESDVSPRKGKGGKRKRRSHSGSDFEGASKIMGENGTKITAEKRLFKDEKEDGIESSCVAEKSNLTTKSDSLTCSSGENPGEKEKISNNETKNKENQALLKTVELEKNILLEDNKDLKNIDTQVESGKITNETKHDITLSKKRKNSSEEQMGENIKRVRISEDVEQVELLAESGKKKRKKKKKVKTKLKDLPEIRVLSKKDWLELRKEYLNHQKESMSKMKKILQKCSHSQQRPRLSTEDNQEEKMEEETSSKKPLKRKEFLPDVIIKVTCDQPMTRKDIKTKMVEFGEVAYVDMNDGETDAYVRCVDAENAKRITESTVENVHLSLLSGEDEKQYWVKINADQEKRRSTKPRNKMRGKNKLVAHAEKMDAKKRKHILFDD